MGAITSFEQNGWFGLNRPDAMSPDIAIVGIPYDGAVCYRRGAALGPDRIREVSAQIPPVIETGEVLDRLLIRDAGNLPFGTDFAASFSQIEDEIARHAATAFVLTLGGDHSIAIPVHRAFGRVASRPIGLIYIDAHTDLSDRFDGSPYSHACPLRRTLETARFSPENTLLVATRCFERAGLEYIREHRMTVFSADDIAQRGMQAVGRDILAQCDGLSNVYLSVDIDALDPAYAPGTGIPDAGGISTRELIALLRMLHPLPVIGADLVEVAPPLDHADITSFAAVKLIMELFGLVQRRKLRQQLSRVR